MAIRPDALIPLVGAVVNLGVAIFVFLQNPRSMVGRVFFLLGLSFAVWNFGTYQMFCLPEKAELDKVIFWAGFIQYGVIWIPLTLCHISFLITGVELRRGLWWCLYSLHALLFLANSVPGFIVEDAQWVGYAWYCKGGPGFASVFALFSLMWVSVFILFRHRREQPLLMRRRLTPLIVAQTAITVFGSNDAL